MLKNLFGKKSQKLVTATTNRDLKNETESEDFVKANIIDKERFVPTVDFSDPNNFARFASASKYYVDAINMIQRSYPYDGSLAEKLNFHNDSVDFHNYLFENEYPRTNGYIKIGESYGSVTTASHGYDTPSALEYISFKGGPNAAVSASSKTLKTLFKEANIYDVEDDRTSNLEMNASGGTSVEFWLKKTNFSGSQKQVVFDLWNSSSFGTDEYGRFRIEVSGNQFFVEYSSGSAGVFNTPLGQNLNITGSDWKHYGFSIENTGSSLSMRFYVTGTLNDSSITGSSTGLVAGPMLGFIGALQTPVSGTSGSLGDAKLSGSLDEFRYWRTKRTDKKIKRYWFRQVGGGTNTDEANTDLGIYYKFNEGIVVTGAIFQADKTVLDYSGRVSNGTWVGYTATSRDTGSAMVESGASAFEFKDPILNSSHPRLISLRNAKILTGSLHDQENSSYVFNSFPSWITEEDEVSGEPLKDLVQITGEFFDDVYLKIEALPSIKDAVYRSGKPLPFASRLLESFGFTAPEIFTKSSIFEEILSTDNEREFEEKLHNVKNQIYQNIYNNLIYIYRSKGTEKSIRNLIRCFGVDDELIKINMYADGVDYKLEDSYRYTSVKKNYVDFNDTDRFDSNVYQMTASGNSNSLSYISGNVASGLVGTTFECETIFPKKFEKSSELFFRTDFVSCSLFGMHEADTSSGSNTTFFGSDRAELSVFAIRPEEESKDAYFMLTSSYLGLELTSSTYRDVYDNEKWNFGVRFHHEKYPLSDGVTGSSTGNYNIEFFGVNAVLDVLQNEFLLTSSVTASLAEGHFTAAKRIYVGAHRNNMTGSVLTGLGTNNEHFSDAKISGVRYWLTNVSDVILREHAKDPTNFGPEHPYRNIDAYLTSELNGILVPQIETLALHWDFDTVTGSDNGSGIGPSNTSDAKFLVEDSSSGSVDLQTRWSFIGNISKAQHPGRGDFFLRNNNQVVQREYVFAARKRLPETLNSDDLIEIRSQDDENFTRDKRPVNHYFAIEKSMYQNLSEEMIKFFGTITDFNNLIGDPINRYRQRYNDLDKLRTLFFERIENTPDLEKYVDFYKWIDNSITQMTLQLIPASANFSTSLSTVIESHVLERNKYWNKYPTLELKQEPPEAAAQSIGKHKYNWKFGHAPVGLQQSDNCLWWRERAERDNKTGIDLNSLRANLLIATLSTLNRRFTQVYDLKSSVTVIDKDPKSVEVAKQVTSFGSGGYLVVEATDFETPNCDDDS